MRLYFVCIALCGLFSFKEENPNLIVWKESQKLSWQDFKGKPEKRFAAASTSYDILKEINKNIESDFLIDIKAVFNTEKSWRKRTWVNDQVLEHEQKHFDIVEIFARKLRKSMVVNSKLSEQELTKKIDSLYLANEKAMDVYQDKYDEETDGSMNGEMQRKWNETIKQELLLLNSFKSTTLIIAGK
jgi:hypothetical protein